MYFKETTMAEQCILKKQQWLEQYIFKETTMAEQYILKKQQWLNNIFERNNNGWKIYFKETTMAEQCI